MSEQENLDFIQHDLDNKISKLETLFLQIEAESSFNSEFENIIGIIHEIEGFASFLDFKELEDISSVFRRALKKMKSTENCVNNLDLLFEILDYYRVIISQYFSKSEIEKNESIIESLNEILFNKKTVANSIKLTEQTITGGELIIDENMLNDFLLSAHEMMDELEKNIFAYEKEDSAELINNIFRICHNIKGDSAYLNLSLVTSYTHILEDLLDYIRNGKIARSSEVIEILLFASDQLKNVFQNININNINILTQDDVDLLKESVNIIYKNASIEIQENKTESVDIEHDSIKAFKEQLIQYRETLENQSNKLDNDSKVIIKRVLENIHKASAYNNYTDLCELTSLLMSSFKELSNDELKINILSLVNQISSILDSDKSIKESAKNTLSLTIPSKTEIQQPTLSDHDSKKETKTMRINEQKIFDFSNIIGELLIAKNTYEFILNDIGDKLVASQLKPLKDNLNQISRITNDLQLEVMSLRMIPIGSVFQKFTRVVRDIAKKTNKEIELIIEGEETEVDKNIADAFSEPLIHLIRNSCDHGIETPSEREKINKSKKGTILLKSYHEGSNLIIKIIDDGKGIDRVRVREKAIEQGLDISNYTDDTIVNLIFNAGFSTKAEVTDLSGRGVGMDVVNTTINSLGGEIHIDTKANIGTTMTIKIPMSMGVSNALLIEHKKQVYAIPFQYILETRKVKGKDIKKLHDKLGFFHRGEIVVGNYIDNLFVDNYQINDKWQVIKNESNRDENYEITVAILNSKNGQFAIFFDKLLYHQEIAIKQAPAEIQHIKKISGVSILGDGKVILVLNPDYLT